MGRLHTLKRLPQLGLGVCTERREVVGDAAREEEGRLQDEREARAQLVQADAPVPSWNLLVAHSSHCDRPGSPVN